LEGIYAEKKKREIEDLLGSDAVTVAVPANSQDP